jgi:uncharacterized protein YggE
MQRPQYPHRRSSGFVSIGIAKLAQASNASRNMNSERGLVMKRILLISLTTIALHGICFAQASGNAAYSQTGGNTRARQNEKSKHVLQQGEPPPSATSMFLEANVLMNVKADEYVAVFGVLQEGATVAECNQKMDATVSEFSGELKQLGISSDDLFVDFAAQNKIYGFQVTGAIARERLVGFELKKNVSVHYKDKLLLDKLVIAASKSKIFDLIKVDYVVRDPAAIQGKLMDDAAQVIKQKAAMYEKTPGHKTSAPGSSLRGETEHLLSHRNV